MPLIREDWTEIWDLPVSVCQALLRLCCEIAQRLTSCVSAKLPTLDCYFPFSIVFSVIVGV